MFFLSKQLRAYPWPWCIVKQTRPMHQSRGLLLYNSPVCEIAIFTLSVRYCATAADRVHRTRTNGNEICGKRSRCLVVIVVIRRGCIYLQTRPKVVLLCNTKRVSEIVKTRRQCRLHRNRSLVSSYFFSLTLLKNIQRELNS